MKEQTIFDILYPKFKFDKTIRTIELFGGYGSQALSLKYLGIKFEHWKLCEWAVKSIQAYKDVHFADDNNDYSDFISKETLIDILYTLGISQNYNEPMSLQQIKRLSEKQLRTIYNNIKATHNLVNIQQVKGKDLEIVDQDKYIYLMTYSFPCQDLSLAGKRGGMNNTSTRSGMLWEVERILTECNELGTLPQVLLMENVPQVHNEDNLPDFNKWKYRLEELGYKNYFQDLIATDYGIPQTRNRCFMVSILGDYSYTFPPKIPLKLKLKDLLEDNVKEKYYLSDKMISFFIHNTEKQKEKGNNFSFSVSNGETSAKTITTKEGHRMDDNFIATCLLKNKGSEFSKFTDNANTIMARDYKGFGNQEMNAVIKIEKNNKKVNEMCNDLLENHKIKENDTLLTNFISRRIKENDIIQNNNITPTLTTSATEIGVCVNEKSNDTLFIKNATAKGYIEATTTEGNAHGVVSSDLRIRRLTPRECLRLMGVREDDINNMMKNQSESSLYHLAGDSIVINVLMSLFKMFL